MKFWASLLSKSRLNLVPKAAGQPRVTATRPLLLHSHKASLSSSHSHQVRPHSALHERAKIIHISS